MIHNGVEFHNVVELEEGTGFGGGLLLRRYPREVRHTLGERGRFISEEATGCEIRFVTAGANVKITLTLPEADGVVKVFRGGFFHSEHSLSAGVTRTLLVSAPARVDAAGDALGSGDWGSRFDPRVWRFCFGRSVVVFHGVNAFGHPVRPPERHEAPPLRWLAYGSSITHGGENSSMSYVEQAARLLGADVLNKGLSGACQCDPAVAGFLAEQQNVDLITLEMGVNMRDSVPAEEFASRTGYVLEQIMDRQPDTPLFVITIYPNFSRWLNPEAARVDERFNEILREHVGRLGKRGNLHLIEGSDILRRPEDLSCDLIHPSDWGHIAMGHQLAGVIRAKLG